MVPLRAAVADFKDEQEAVRFVGEGHHCGQTHESAHLGRTPRNRGLGTHDPVLETAPSPVARSDSLVGVKACGPPAARETFVQPSVRFLDAGKGPMLETVY
mmetsp:Transcript_4879/g.10323  ORF Transcript_4879/g.10323 Transcript_4879/m.10323 type:complete len:101 (+) Transcript_4879:998-1300(+)